MTKRLCIDCGNTRVKAAVLNDGEVCHRVVATYDDLEPLTLLMRQHEVEEAMLVSTTDAQTDVEDLLARHLHGPVKVLDHHTAVPLTIAYRTPDTLGLDRVASAVGAWREFTGCNLLVVDAGTAITQDLVLKDGTFLGGVISPGVDMRLQAMHHFTNRLPLVDSQGDTPLVGYDTTTAMRSGAVLGAAAEVECRARALTSLLGQLKVLLTGGNAALLAPLITIDRLQVVDDLLFKGLDTIMDMNGAQ